MFVDFQVANSVTNKTNKKNFLNYESDYSIFDFTIYIIISISKKQKFAF